MNDAMRKEVMSVPCHGEPDCCAMMEKGPESPVPTPEDAWKHRGKHMRCSSCMWFVPKPPELPAKDRGLGRCRKHAPSAEGWVPVFAHDWCGDHRLDENKVGR